MTRATFSEIVSTQKNPIRDWVRFEVKDKSLSRKLDTTSKERMILSLERYLKKVTKKLAKKR